MWQAKTGEIIIRVTPHVARALGVAREAAPGLVKHFVQGIGQDPQRSRVFLDTGTGFAKALARFV